MNSMNTRGSKTQTHIMITAADYPLIKTCFHMVACTIPRYDLETLLVREL